MPRERAMGALLSRYYHAQREMDRLQRERARVEVRIAYLTTELAGRSLQPLEESTIPGTVARYEGPTGHGNGVGNPTEAMVLRMDACHSKASEELQERRVQLYDVERAITDLTDLQALLGNVLTQLDPGDRQLLEWYYRDRQTWEQIAYREESGYTDASGPRKRVARIEADLQRALCPDPVAAVRRRLSEIVPVRVRNTSRQGSFVMLS